MRRFNTRLFLCLLGLGVVGTGAVFGIHYLQTGRIARALLWQAQHAEEEGKLDQAARFYSRYVEFVPEDTEQLAQLGRILGDEKVSESPRALQRALFVLSQVIVREPERHDSRRLLAKVALRFGRPDLAEEHLVPLSKALPQDGEVQMLLGRAHAGQQRWKDAAAAYWQATRLAPEQRDAYLELAALVQDHPDEAKAGTPLQGAEQVFDELVARNSQSYQAYLARWTHRVRWGNLHEPDNLTNAARDVAEALRLAPGEAEPLLAAADLARRKQQYDEARGHLDKARRLHPKDHRVYQALARIELLDRKPDQALVVLREGTRALPAQAELFWDLANLLIDNDRIDEAKETLARLGKTNAAPAAATYLEARLLMRDRKWAQAVLTLERTRILLENRAPQLLVLVDLFLGECYGRLGESAQQLAAYQRAADRDPTSTIALQGLAAAQWAMGRVEDAVARYRQIAEQPEARAEAWIDYARVLLIRSLQRGERRWQDVSRALDWADRLQTNHPGAIVLRAELFAARGQVDEARRLLSEAKTRQPSEAVFWTALAALEDGQKDSARALAILTEAEKHVQDRIALHLAQARYCANHPGEQATAALAKLAASLDSIDDEAAWTRLTRGLAEAYHRLGDLTRAREMWDGLVDSELYAHDVRAQQVRFDLAVEAGDDAALPGILEQIKRLEGGEGNLWRHGEAVRLIRAARSAKDQAEMLEQARRLLDSVGRARPSWAPVYLARGDLEVLLGNTEQAIALYREAIQLGERSPRLVRQLVQLLAQAQRYDEADEVLQSFQKRGPLSGELQQLAAEVLLTGGQLERAHQLVQGLSADPRDYRDLLWLGRIQVSKGDRAGARKSLEKAVELGSAVPETWVSLVRFLATDGQPDEARKVVERARTHLAAEDRELALAACAEALGDTEQAARHYRAALEARPDNVTVMRGVVGFYLRVGRLNEAEPLLRRLIDRKIKVTEGDVSWARHGLALVLSAQNDYSAFVRALEQVGLAVDARGQVIEVRTPAPAEVAEELRARAQVLATQRQRVFRARAIACLEDLGRRQALTAEDQFLLARLYEADGFPAKAREHLRALAAAHKQNAAYLASYAHSLVEQRELGEAERCIERLESLEKEQAAGPGSHGSVELRAQWFEAQGNGARAVELLRQRAGRADARPEDVYLLIGCLQRQGRIDEALDACDKAWTTCPPENVGGIAIALLRSGKSTAAQRARVERWLQDAAARHPTAVMLLLHRADLYDLLGRYAEAESLYREALARDARNVVALNNLAWLLAQKSPKDAREALPLIERAIQSAGPQAELLDTRGSVFLAMGNNARAIADLKEASSDTPTPPRHFRLAQAYYQARDREAALTAFRKAKASGLEPDQLHPVEQVTYRKVLNDLQER